MPAIKTNADSPRKSTRGFGMRLSRVLKKDWQLYILLLLPLAFVVVFKYAAYPGLRIAFMDFKPARGYSGSEWVGLETFAKIFKDADFIRAIRNSMVFNFPGSLYRVPGAHHPGHHAERTAAENL